MWIACTGVRLLLHVPPGQVGKRASLFGQPRCATGWEHSEICGATAIDASLTCFLLSCPGPAPLVGSVAEDARPHAEAYVVSVGLSQETAVKALALPAVSGSKESRGAKPGSRSGNKMCLA